MAALAGMALSWRGGVVTLQFRCSGATFLRRHKADLCAWDRVGNPERDPQRVV